ncbi:MAG: polysaccharide deacetylase family protein [Crenarchaeota archaeon]|nr:polysaccharide deacetylase family protein [Thermoproteota archaeon]
MLTWEQIQTLYKQGISFGSHTCTHPRLSRLSQDQSWHELIASKECLETRLNKEIPLIGYPHGDFNSAVQRMAMAAGYKAACGWSWEERAF